MLENALWFSDFISCTEKIDKDWCYQSLFNSKKKKTSNIYFRDNNKRYN